MTQAHLELLHVADVADGCDASLVVLHVYVEQVALRVNLGGGGGRGRGGGNRVYAISDHGGSE